MVDQLRMVIVGSSTCAQCLIVRCMAVGQGGSFDLVIWFRRDLSAVLSEARVLHDAISTAIVAACRGQADD